MTMSEIQPTLPRTDAEIDPAWLTQVLRASGMDVTVESLRRESLGEGVGLMSGLESMHITYADGEGPAVLILKRPAANEANRAVAATFDLYLREVLFYRDVADRCAAAMPGIYFAEIDGDDFVLVVEDLSAMLLGDQIAGATIEQARSLMRWMARLHASFWGRTDNDPSLEFLPMVHPSYSSEGLMQGAAFGWDPMVENFGDVVPPHIAALKDRFLEALPAMFEWMATGPLTVIHGDVRMDNIFFADGDVDHVIAVDWQGALRGRAAQDLGYFMGGNLATELRRAHERELIEVWHAELCTSGVGDYTLEDAWLDYRRGLLFTWTHATVIAGTLDHTNERGRAWVAQMLSRATASIDDLDLVDLIDEALT